MCLSIFLYFVVIFFLFFSFLLSAAAWALPCRKAQYGSVCKSESGGHKAEKSENHPAKFSARWLPAGIIWGLEIFFPPIILSPFSCMVSKLESRALTLLLTQPLRDGCNSSLSVAPVIEPSVQERMRKRGPGREGEQGKETAECDGGKESNAVVISRTS